MAAADQGARRATARDQRQDRLLTSVSFFATDDGRQAGPWELMHDVLASSKRLTGADCLEHVLWSCSISASLAPSLRQLVKFIRLERSCRIGGVVDGRGSGRALGKRPAPSHAPANHPKIE
jgi:hypothetical protein